MTPSTAPLSPAWRLALALCLALALGACATRLITPADESQWGADMAEKVARQIGLYRDDELQAYLQAVGDRLVAELEETPYTFRFAIVDQFEPNAFAGPGGYIYVSRGLLSLLNSEAELAGVLAHEISHVTQRHHTRQAGKELGAGLLTLPGRAVGMVSEDLGTLINAPIVTAEAVILSSYSRSQESEADSVGLRLAARAGYDPAALVDALTNLERAVLALTGERHEARFFDSHPTTPERVRQVRTSSDRVTVSDRAPLATRRAMLQLLDGLWVGPHNPQQGLFRDQLFLSADLNLALPFPENWETRNTPTYVAAASPDGNGRILMTGVGREESIAELAGKLTTELSAHAGTPPTERATLTVGGWPAELVAYRIERNEQATEFAYLFVATETGTMLPMAEGAGDARATMRASLLGLHPLSAKEAGLITGPRLRLVTAQSGETAETAGARAGGLWLAPFAAAANGVGDNERLSSGALVKLARPETYRP